MQELRFSYTDVVTLLALITSVGAVWRLNKELRAPHRELAETVAENRRLLQERAEILKRIDMKATAALKAVILIADGKDPKRDLLDLLSEMEENREL